MNIISVLFPTVSIIIYFGLHWFLYFSTTKFFSITGFKTKLLTLISYWLLAASFFIAVAIADLSNFILLRAYYFIGAFWLGFFVYLLLTVIVAWIVIWGFKFIDLDVKLIAGTMAFMLALLISICGVWNAFHLQVEDVEVNIKNLPVSWQDKTIVQLSDTHLGKINGVSWAEKVVEQTNNLDPYVVVITGDLFDGIGSDPDLYIKTLDKLAAPGGVYFVPGNHEGYLGLDKAFTALQKTRIEILNNQLAEVDGVQIVGFAFPDPQSSQTESDVWQKVGDYQANKPSILLYHAPTSIESATAGDWQNYLSPNTIFSLQKKHKIDLQLSGHTHQGQLWPFTWITKKIFKGYDYGLVTDGDFSIYTTSGTGTWGPPLRVGSRSEIVSIKLK